MEWNHIEATAAARDTIRCIDHVIGPVSDSSSGLLVLHLFREEILKARALFQIPGLMSASVFGNRGSAVPSLSGFGCIASPLSLKRR